jgi:hypothetical protein
LVADSLRAHDATRSRRERPSLQENPELFMAFENHRLKLPSLPISDLSRFLKTP